MLKSTFLFITCLLTLNIYAIKTSFPADTLTIEDEFTKWCYVDERGNPDSENVAGTYSRVLSNGNCVAHIDIGQKAIVQGIISKASAHEFIEITFGKNQLVDKAKNFRIIKAPKRHGEAPEGFQILSPDKHTLVLKEGVFQIGLRKIEGMAFYYKRINSSAEVLKTEEDSPSPERLLCSLDSASKASALSLQERFEDGTSQIHFYSEKLSGHHLRPRHFNESFRLLPFLRTEGEAPMAQVVSPDFDTNVAPL